MSICDTSFIIRLIEFNKHKELDPSNHAITPQVKDELESKDLETIMEDLQRAFSISQKHDLDLTVISSSSFTDEIDWFIENSNNRDLDFQTHIQSCTDQRLLDLEKGEQSCYFGKTQSEYILTEDFAAYNILYKKTNGDVACLIEILVDSNDLTKEEKDLIRALDALLLPEEKLDTNIWSVINSKIERNLDDRISVS